ncbi:hypothetical protein [Streptomyces sp. Tue6028]|uniref:hypothetical protein n=1 Tax=Streptomyces sp. Tue6028 TaxID=2036037 RepID=UPI003D74DCBD
MSSHMTHHAVDGYVEEIPDPHWGIASFTLIHSPADADQAAPDTPDTVYACITSVPRVNHTLRRDVEPGALVRVDGITVQPSGPGGPVHLTVTALQVLSPAPAPPSMALERYGDYIVVFDAATDAVPVFTTSGEWVGEALDADGIAALIGSHNPDAGGAA